jgi:hypothetical protein
MTNLTSAKYRIVRDLFSGFEVQLRRWWWPCWRQVGRANTHRSREDAEAFARRHAANGTVVKRLGCLPKEPDDV